MVFRVWTGVRSDLQIWKEFWSGSGKKKFWAGAESWNVTPATSPVKHGNPHRSVAVDAGTRGMNKVVLLKGVRGGIQEAHCTRARRYCGSGDESAHAKFFRSEGQHWWSFSPTAVLVAITSIESKIWVARWPVFHRPGQYITANLAEAGKRPVFWKLVPEDGILTKIICYNIKNH